MAEAVWKQGVFLTSGSLGKSIMELVIHLILFALVLVACVFTTRFVAGRQIQRGRNSNFKPVETYQIAQNRYLQLVQVGTRYFVIAVTKETISLIAEMKEEELSLGGEGGSGAPKSFQEILKEFKVKVDKHENTGK